MSVATLLASQVLVLMFLLRPRIYTKLPTDLREVSKFPENSPTKASTSAFTIRIY